MLIGVVTVTRRDTASREDKDRPSWIQRLARS